MPLSPSEVWISTFPPPQQAVLRKNLQYLTPDPFPKEKTKNFQSEVADLLRATQLYLYELFHFTPTSIEGWHLARAARSVALQLRADRNTSFFRIANFAEEVTTRFFDEAYGSDTFFALKQLLIRDPREEIAEGTSPTQRYLKNLQDRMHHL